jgi:hypothetical protein
LKAISGVRSYVGCFQGFGGMLLLDALLLCLAKCLCIEREKRRPYRFSCLLLAGAIRSPSLDTFE